MSELIEECEVFFFNGNLVVDIDWVWNNGSGCWNRNQDLVITNILIMSLVFSVSAAFFPAIYKHFILFLSSKTFKTLLVVSRER